MIESAGFRVLRVGNDDVRENLAGVVEVIAKLLGEGRVTPSPRSLINGLPKREGDKTTSLTLVEESSRLRHEPVFLNPNCTHGAYAYLLWFVNLCFAATLSVAIARNFSPPEPA